MTRRGERQEVVRRPGDLHQAIRHALGGKWTPTAAEVAEQVGAGERYVRKVLDRMREAGEVEVAELAEPSGGRPARRWRLVAPAIFGVLCLVLGACQMSPGQRVDWNERAHATAEENVREGLPDATVWCMEPSNGNPATTDADTTAWVVSSARLVRFGGDCDAATVFTTDGISCDQTFCYVGGQ